MKAELFIIKKDRKAAAVIRTESPVDAKEIQEAAEETKDMNDMDAAAFLAGKFGGTVLEPGKDYGLVSMEYEYKEDETAAESRAGLFLVIDAEGEMAGLLRTPAPIKQEQAQYVADEAVYGDVFEEEDDGDPFEYMERELFAEMLDIGDEVGVVHLQ